MSKPLYQQLNEQRTQGEWELSGDKHDIQTADEAKLGLFALYAYEKAEANAQYTALAVNNLHHLAEALARLVDRIEENELQDHFPSAYNRAKQALSRIS